MPTTERVHPAPLYEALAAFLIAAMLSRLRDRLSPGALFGAFAVLIGLEQLLVEFIRTGDVVVLGLTQAPLWSLGLIALGLAIAYRSSSGAAGRRLSRSPAGA
jgi:phosphatidylglycerol:prolipoprotein diacylglycerol transferase